MVPEHDNLKVVIALACATSHSFLNLRLGNMRFTFKKKKTTAKDQVMRCLTEILSRVFVATHKQLQVVKDSVSKYGND